MPSRHWVKYVTQSETEEGDLGIYSWRCSKGEDESRLHDDLNKISDWL